MASFVVNFLTEEGLGISKAKASNMFSICQATFTVGRFVGVILLNYIDPALLLGYHALMCTLASILVATLSGWSAVVFLYVLFFFESICYPVSSIYSLSTLLIRLSRYQFSFLFSKKRKTSLIIDVLPFIWK